MRKLQLILLSIIFFFWTFQKIFANQCTTTNIANYFEKYGSVMDSSEKYEELKFFIDSQRVLFKKPNSSITEIFKSDAVKKINEMNRNFIDLQDEKFSLSIKYVLKKFLEKTDWKNNKADSENWTKKILEKFQEKKWNVFWKNFDFFINNYLEETNKKWEKINKNPDNIPTSVLQNSVYLDFLIFSCELWEFKTWKEFKSWWLIKNLMSESDSIDFEKNEILEKQQIVVNKAIARYQSFLTNREMYIALRWVIEKLEHLKWRFEDFARLIWFLPAKIVDFWYKWN